MANSLSEIERWLQQRDDRWTVRFVPPSPPGGHQSILVEHPAGYGMGFVLDEPVDNGRQGQEAVQRVLDSLTSSPETEICRNAPQLVHPELRLGFRTVVVFHDLENLVCRSLAFLMYEHGQVTEPEAAWMAGFLGRHAPMELQSPLGPAAQA